MSTALLEVTNAATTQACTTNSGSGKTYIVILVIIVIVAVVAILLIVKAMKSKGKKGGDEAAKTDKPAPDNKGEDNK